MKKSIISTVIVIFAIISYSNAQHHSHAGQEHQEMSNKSKNLPNDIVLQNYIALKNALVKSNNNDVKTYAKILADNLKNFDYSSYNEKQKKHLKDILEDGIEHAIHMSKSSISHQREHFKHLSNDMVNLISITGVKNTVYQQFCPMYKGGSLWLSLESDIKNPYYGATMLSCGAVQKIYK